MCVFFLLSKDLLECSFRERFIVNCFFLFFVAILHWKHENKKIRKKKTIIVDFLRRTVTVYVHFCIVTSPAALYWLTNALYRQPGSWETKTIKWLCAAVNAIEIAPTSGHLYDEEQSGMQDIIGTRWSMIFSSDQNVKYFSRKEWRIWL